LRYCSRHATRVNGIFLSFLPIIEQVTSWIGMGQAPNHARAALKDPAALMASSLGKPIELSGEWSFALDPQDHGEHAKPADRRIPDSIRLPGPLARVGFGAGDACGKGRVLCKSTVLPLGRVTATIPFSAS
jgi:hypothetical protein